MAAPPTLNALLFQVIGKRLQAARGIDLSQSALAQQAGVTRAAISAIEAGQQGVSISTLCQLAIALGVQPGELLPSLEELHALERRSAEAASKRPAEEIVDEFLSLRGLKP